MNLVKLIELVSKFIVEVIHYTAWPTVILVVLLVFCKPIISLIERFKKVGIKHGDKEYFFEADAIMKHQKKVSKQSGFIEVSRDTLDFDNYLDVLEMWTGTLGLLAFEWCNQPKWKSEQPIIQNCFKILIMKLDKERPNEKLLSSHHKLLALLESFQKHNQK